MVDESPTTSSGIEDEVKPYILPSYIIAVFLLAYSIFGSGCSSKPQESTVEPKPKQETELAQELTEQANYGLLHCAAV